jgi:hypothetical protein
MANTILNVVRSNVVSGDSLSNYHNTDRIAIHYELTLEDLRCSILSQFVEAVKKNGVTPDTRLCLVFDSAGSAVFEKMFVLVAISVLNVSDIHVIFSDRMYVDSYPDINDLPVTVEFVDGDCSLLDAMKRIRGNGYQVMMNAIFIQKGFSPSRDTTDSYSQYTECLKKMKENYIAHIECMRMCMRYGIYFTNSDYENRDSIEYTEHPILKDFTGLVKLIEIGCFRGV